jgi:hypothetical protein
MYPLGTWCVSGICVWIPCIKETLMMVVVMMMMIIIIFFKVVKNVSKKCSAEVFVDYLTLMVALRSCETPELLDRGGGNSKFL